MVWPSSSGSRPAGVVLVAVVIGPLSSEAVAVAPVTLLVRPPVAADDPKLSMLAIYAATGGTEFVIQAWLLSGPDELDRRAPWADQGRHGRAARSTARPWST
jgi:hypothetical protein